MATQFYLQKATGLPAFTPQPQSITALWLVLNLPSHRGQKAESTLVAGYIPKLECGPMPNMMAALPNIGGALCSTPQSLADAHF